MIDYQEIEGANTATLESDPVTEYAMYQCYVQDGYGNTGYVYFNVTVENHFSAYVTGSQNKETSTTIRVAPGSADPITLSVTAEADNMEGITYTWYKSGYGPFDNEIEGETAETLTISEITSSEEYYCNVRDAFGNSQNVWFYLRIDNNFSVYIATDYGQTSQITVPVSYNDTTTMQVSYTATNTSMMTFQWSKGVRVPMVGPMGETGYMIDYQDIEGANTDTLESDPVTESVMYRCYVQDGFGNAGYVFFDVKVENHFSAYITGSQPPATNKTISVEPRSSDPVILSVTAQADDMEGITYTWYKSSRDMPGREKIEGADTNEYILQNVERTDYYYCEVKDKYGNSQTISFYIRIENNFTAFVNGSVNQDWSKTFIVDTESVRMSVGTRGNDLSKVTYAWYQMKEDEDGDLYYDLIAGNNTSELELSPVTASGSYVCTVEDGYGTSVDVTFKIVLASDIQEIKLNELTTAKVTSSGMCLFKFVPAESGQYNFLSKTESDTYGYLYDAQMNQLASNDDGGNNLNFMVTCTLEAGKTYYLGARFYDNSSTGEFPVMLTDVYLRAYAKDYNNTVYVKPKAKASLELHVEAKDLSKVTYQWYLYEGQDGPMGDGSWKTLEGCTSDHMETDAITKYTRYYCHVEDNIGNVQDVYFYVYVDNGFMVTQTQSNYYIPVHGNVELTFTATAEDDSMIAYQWYQASAGGMGPMGTILEGETTNTLKRTDLTSTTQYYCDVNDGYGNSRRVYFYVYVNSFKAEAASARTVDVKPGGSATLKVTVTADDMSSVKYQWYDSYNETMLSGETNAELELKNLMTYGYYYCLITDDYGNNATISFNVRVNHFAAYASGTTMTSVDIYPSKDGKAILKVDVTGDDTSKVTYSWSSMGMGPSLGDGPTLEVSDITTTTYYYCYVNDGYGNGSSVRFRVVTNNFRAYAKGTEDTVVHIYVPYNGGTTLQVDVTADDMSGVTYTWYDNQGGMGAGLMGVVGNTDSITVDHVTRLKAYRCYVTDNYGNSAQIYFYIHVENNLRAYDTKTNKSEVDVTVAKNGSTTLSITATATDTEGLRYQWYRRYDYAGGYYDAYALAGESSSSLKLTDIQEEAAYYCTVMDKYDNSVSVFYFIHISGEEVAVRSITLNEESIRLATNSTFTLTATVAPENATDKTLTWSSSDTAVATVNKNGVVTAKTYGTAVITATSADGKVKATCSVQTYFYDVTSGYYYNPVYWAADLGITKGYSSGEYAGAFGVGLNCTRQDLMIFLWRAEGCPTGYGDARNMFNDVTKGPNTAANQAIAWGYSTGIVKGYKDGGFHPNDPIVRKDVMIMLYRVAGKPAVSGTVTFTDVIANGYKTTSDTYKAILWGVQKGITNGYSSGEYAGQFGCTLNCLREQIVTFLYRYKK